MKRKYPIVKCVACGISAIGIKKHNLCKVCYSTLFQKKNMSLKEVIKYRQIHKRIKYNKRELNYDFPIKNEIRTKIINLMKNIVKKDENIVILESKQKKCIHEIICKKVFFNKCYIPNLFNIIKLTAKEKKNFIFIKDRSLDEILDYKFIKNIGAIWFDATNTLYSNKNTIKKIFMNHILAKDSLFAITLSHRIAKKDFNNKIIPDTIKNTMSETLKYLSQLAKEYGYDLNLHSPEYNSISYKGPGGPMYTLIFRVTKKVTVADVAKQVGIIAMRILNEKQKEIIRKEIENKVISDTF